MRFSPRSRAALVPAAAALGLFLTPVAEPRPHAGWGPVTPALPSFFQQSGAARVQNPVTVPGQAPALGPPPLPNSVLPADPQTSCSVWSDPQGFPTCSTFVQTLRCSAQCLAGSTCSAIGFGVGGQGHCSTLGPRAVCSVVQPSSNPPLGQSVCSAVSNTPKPGLSCSTIGIGRRQACSAENGATVSSDICSTSVPSGAECSVLNAGASERSFCSTGFGGNKFCSTFNGGGNECSVELGGRGVCTNLKGAPNGSCSTFDMGHCSVIGGAGGTRCRQP